jgi:hypothetical protein
MRCTRLHTACRRSDQILQLRDMFRCAALLLAACLGGCGGNTASPPVAVGQVTRWQCAAGQTWQREDIEDVAAYLNRQFYDLPCPLPRCKAGTVG